MPMLRSQELANRCPLCPALLWLLEGQVLSNSELRALCNLCQRENRLKIVVEMGGSRMLRWQSLALLIGSQVR